MSDTNISSVLKNIVDNYWLENKEPILLSRLPLSLEEKDPNFREKLRAVSLKSFIEDTSDSCGYRLIKHPTQKAKIGVIPEGKDYSFPEEDKLNRNDIKKKPVKNKGNSAINLIELLSELPEDDLEKINIPLSVIVKLFKLR